MNAFGTVLLMSSLFVASALDAFDLSPSSFYHAGDTEGYYAAVIGSNDGRMGVAIMTHGTQAGHLINEILQAVAKEYGWED